MNTILRFSPVLAVAMALPVAPFPLPSLPPPAPKPAPPADGPGAASDSWPSVVITLSDLQWGPDGPFETHEPQKIASPNRAARRNQTKNRR